MKSRRNSSHVPTKSSSETKAPTRPADDVGRGRGAISQGWTRRITQPYDLRLLKIRMHPSLHKSISAKLLQEASDYSNRPTGHSSAENLFMKDLARDASVMGLYDCMPVIKSIAPNTNAVATREKYTILSLRHQKTRTFALCPTLKKIHLVLASDMRARGLQDEVVRVRR